LVKHDPICLSVDGLEPSPHFVESLRQQDLNVQNSTEQKERNGQVRTAAVAEIPPMLSLRKERRFIASSLRGYRHIIGRIEAAAQANFTGRSLCRISEFYSERH
jgi:hypothetical protein